MSAVFQDLRPFGGEDYYLRLEDRLGAGWRGPSTEVLYIKEMEAL